MRPSFWHPSVELSSIEQTIITRIKRAKLFVFLRYHRHELFDDAFQEELVTLYAPSLRGHPPFRLLNWPWLPLCKRTRVFRMMKSLKRPLWIDAGSWYWIVWTRGRHRSAKERWWPSANCLSRRKWIDG